jgi:hypothetical protein
VDGRLGLELRDPNGVLRGLMGIGPDGTPALYFYDAATKTRANLSFAPGNKLSLALFDKDGKSTFTAP